MQKRKKIAIVFHLGVPHIERLIRGIMDYAAVHGQWSFVLSAELHEPSIAGLAGWDGHGAFAMLDHHNAPTARRLHIPLVNLSGSLEDSPAPRVRVDEQAVGGLAAKHLMGCGFRRYAYYGFEPAWYSEARGQGFMETLKPAGFTCACYASPTGLGGRDRTDEEWKRLVAWLRTIQPPFGLMACSDQWAVAAMEACHDLGLKVPDDVAVIGVNDNELTCEHCQPKLSSVIRPDREIGFQAAALLDRLMAKKKAARSEIVLPPVGIAARGSTDVRAAENPYVKRAVHFVREHIGDGIGVQDVLKHAGGSRRLLEYRFREHVGRTPYQFICDVRVERARHLLAEQPKTRLKEISQACGFHDLQRFRQVFTRLTGHSPRKYRTGLPSPQPQADAR